MKEKDPVVLALSIGTTQLVALRASFGENQVIRVEAWQKKDPAGFDKGLVRDSELATDEIRQILEQTAEDPEWYHLPLYGVISNPAIRTYRISSSLYFPGTKSIGEQDVERVISQTRAVATIPLDEVILCTVPQEYLVNDLPEVKNPLGLEGRRLSVTLHLFTMPVTAYQGLNHLFNRLEVEPELLIPRGLASSTLVLKEEEKRDGVLLVDVGGFLSELFYFYQGTLRFSKIIPWGTEAVTELISRQWEIPPRDARRLKEEFGTLEPGAAGAVDTIPYMDGAGRIRFKIPSALFQEKIQKGLEQGLALFESEIREIKSRFPHLYQLVFSGGATRMNGFLEFLQNKLSIPSRLGFGSGIQAPQELSAHPGYHGILGLLKYIHSPEPDARPRHAKPGLFSKTVDHFKGWVHDYF